MNIIYVFTYDRKAPISLRNYSYANAYMVLREAILYIYIQLYNINYKYYLKTYW